MCTTPIHLKNGAFVPCGKCYECRSRKRADWVFRMMQEFKSRNNVYFCTLTYSPDNVPNKLYDCTHLSRYDVKNFETLSKDHASEFLKRLQKAVKLSCDDKYALCRYYLTGEYGDLHNHPHYHVILFFPDSFPIKERNGIQDFVSELWRFGFTDTKIATQASMNYLAKHQMKECLGNDYQQKFAPIFSKMSRYGGGLGKDYITENTLMYHEKNKSSLVVLNGYKMPLPSFYRKKIYPKLSDEQMSNFVARSQDEYWLRFNAVIGQHKNLLGYAEYDYTERYHILKKIGVEKDKKYLRMKKTKLLLKKRRLEDEF